MIPRFIKGAPNSWKGFNKHLTYASCESVKKFRTDASSFFGSCKSRKRVPVGEIIPMIRQSKKLTHMKKICETAIVKSSKKKKHTIRENIRSDRVIHVFINILEQSGVR